MSSVENVLKSRGSNWHSQGGASDEELSALQAAVSVSLPNEYLALLRASNGGDGELALAPLWLQLHSASEVADLQQSKFHKEEFPGLLFFASNGGLESIAFDTRAGEPWPIVMVDCIAGIESAELIATDITEFIDAIGVVAI